MFRKAGILSFGFLATISLLSTNIFACACCAEPGTRINFTTNTDQVIRDLVKEFKIADKAELYMTEAGFDIIEGLDQIQKEDEATTGLINFSASGSFAGNSWKLTLRSVKGLPAIYSIPVPLKYSEFKVDIHDRKDMPLGPWLYKEIRFEGTLLSATGFARAGAVRDTRYSLVFQGRGVGCNEVEDFTHWRMEINGPKARYAFFGKLSSGRKEEVAESTALLDRSH